MLIFNKNCIWLKLFLIGYYLNFYPDFEKKLRHQQTRMTVSIKTKLIKPEHKTYEH